MPAPLPPHAPLRSARSSVAPPPRRRRAAAAVLRVPDPAAFSLRSSCTSASGLDAGGPPPPSSASPVHTAAEGRTAQSPRRRRSGPRRPPVEVVLLGHASATQQGSRPLPPRPRPGRDTADPHCGRGSADGVTQLVELGLPSPSPSPSLGTPPSVTATVEQRDPSSTTNRRWRKEVFHLPSTMDNTNNVGHEDLDFYFEDDEMLLNENPAPRPSEEDGMDSLDNAAFSKMAEDAERNSSVHEFWDIINKTFASKGEVYNFYNNYARNKGFGVRKDKVRRSKRSGQLLFRVLLTLIVPFMINLMDFHCVS
ncbi:LOW QUALITY PROTEIN: hypothetical protein U9M48_010206 [Paspalum notatum var. saurae]|uniref:Uncharacterized protein n=1 Tax=Paspalum notatum var. saurae TaxID=547442 RepID=A0AAQ3SSM5_PASNO